mmetsp:Transcript_10824/g.28407  ORF Transcript_10824/g.28407 Transcript_10824/m.28407 type:complete len:164 (+) Transcript_10824:1-492(+)
MGGGAMGGGAMGGGAMGGGNMGGMGGMGGGMPGGGMMGGMMAPPPPPGLFGGFPGGGTGMMIGAELLKTFMQEQERQAQLKEQLKIQEQLGTDTTKIAELQKMLAEQNAKMDALAAQKSALPQPAAAPAAAPGAPSEEQLKLQLELVQQQKQLEALKQQGASN